MFNALVIEKSLKSLYLNPQSHGRGVWFQYHKGFNDVWHNHIILGLDLWNSWRWTSLSFLLWNNIIAWLCTIVRNWDMVMSTLKISTKLIIIAKLIVALQHMSTSVQMMSVRRKGATSLPEPMLNYYRQMDPEEDLSLNFQIAIWNMSTISFKSNNCVSSP